MSESARPSWDAADPVSIRVAAGTTSTVLGYGPSVKRRRKVRWRRDIAWSILAALAAGIIIPLVVKMAEADRKERCRTNMASIGMAFHVYNAAHDSFPDSTIRDRGGRPLLSWRVAILPLLGHRALYDRFHLDEPWDSPHNLPLLASMPSVYACPSEPRVRGFTNYRALVGPQTMFENLRPIKLAEVTDGLSNTIAVAEARDGVPWTKPDELIYAPEDITKPEQPPLPAFGSRHRDGFHAGFADGTVKFLKRTITETTLRAIITRDGGEMLSG